MDEDSWQILAVDQYDNRDQLWRVSEGHVINYYDVPCSGPPWRCTPTFRPGGTSPSVWTMRCRCTTSPSNGPWRITLRRRCDAPGSGSESFSPYGGPKRPGRRDFQGGDGRRRYLAERMTAQVPKASHAGAVRSLFLQRPLAAPHSRLPALAGPASSGRTPTRRDRALPAASPPRRKSLFLDGPPR